MSAVAVAGLGDLEETENLLAVEDLAVEFHHAGRTPLRVIENVGFTVRRGETVALLGESGCGKSVTARAIMGILDPDVARVVNGSVRFGGRELLELTERERRSLRGPEMAIVFQDALVALNPVFSVGWQIAEPFRIHTDLGRPAIRKEVTRLMERMRIPDAHNRAREFPHQFSGGMRQRLLLAMAIALKPRLLIADEPTTALDVTVQAQIMQLLRELRDEAGTAIVLISHDLALVSEEADKVVVMYAGRIVEKGPVDAVFSDPKHPYTKALLESVIPPAGAGGRLQTIPGAPPQPGRFSTGCAFHPRCPLAQEICRVEVPARRFVGIARTSACHFAEEYGHGRQ